MPKFFVKKDQIIDNIIYIQSEDARHIKNVLRLSTGDQIVVSDEIGIDYNAVISAIGRECVTAEVIECVRNYSEPNVEVTLFQGIPKYEKMEYIIQKCVEVGIKKIVPVNTERSIVKLHKGSDVSKKVTRWQKISLEASKQSGRGYVPLIEEPITFLEAIKLSEEYHIQIIPYEKEKDTKLIDCLSKVRFKNAAVIIGPEGGLSQREIDEAIAYGIIPVSLGPRILRTETAGIVTLAAIMYHTGNL